MKLSAVDHMQLAPRCKAKSKRSGFQCRAPAVKGKAVCRMHGARGGGPCGSLNGRYAHGRRTQEAMKARTNTRALIREARELLALIGGYDF